MQVKCTGNLQHASQKTQTSTQTPPADCTHPFGSQAVLNFANPAGDDEDSAIIDVVRVTPQHVPRAPVGKGQFHHITDPGEHQYTSVWSTSWSSPNVPELVLPPCTSSSMTWPRPKRSPQQNYRHNPSLLNVVTALDCELMQWWRPTTSRTEMQPWVRNAAFRQIPIKSRHAHTAVPSVTLARMSAILSHAYNALTS